MSKAERFIQLNTKTYSNETRITIGRHSHWEKQPWLTPEQALAAVEIAKEELIDKACEWLRTHSEDDYFELIPVGNYCGAGNLNKKKMIEDFKKAMEK